MSSKNKIILNNLARQEKIANNTTQSNAEYASLPALLPPCLLASSAECLCLFALPSLMLSPCQRQASDLAVIPSLATSLQPCRHRLVSDAASTARLRPPRARFIRYVPPVLPRLPRRRRDSHLAPSVTYLRPRCACLVGNTTSTSVCLTCWQHDSSLAATTSLATHL